MAGRINVKTSRESLTTWCEQFTRKFNEGEMTDSLPVPVFTKLGQNPFSDQNEKELKEWLDSLNANHYTTLS